MCLSRKRRPLVLPLSILAKSSALSGAVCQTGFASPACAAHIQYMPICVAAFSDGRPSGYSSSRWKRMLSYMDGRVL